MEMVLPRAFFALFWRKITLVDGIFDFREYSCFAGNLP